MSRSRRDFRLYQRRPSGRRRFGIVLLVVCGLFLIHLVLSSFLIDTVSVASISMEPTLSPGQRVFVTPLTFGPAIPFGTQKLPPIRTPERGDLVIVKPPYLHSTTFRRIAEPFVSFFTLHRVSVYSVMDAPYDQRTLIRRVVGVPGDTVRVSGFTAWVRPAGAPEFVEEHELSATPYAITFDPLPSGWSSALPASGESDEFVLSDNDYFLLCDNRGMTGDSRYWGAVGVERITGSVLFRYWPFDVFGVPR